MQEEQNTTLVKNAYAAFLKGDVPALVATMDEDIVWKPVTGAGRHVPFAGERRGTAAVAGFFAKVAEHHRRSRSSSPNATSRKATRW